MSSSIIFVLLVNSYTAVEAEGKKIKKKKKST